MWNTEPMEEHFVPRAPVQPNPSSRCSIASRAESENPMAWELLLWPVAFIGIIALVAVDAYHLICLSDLESDYINPYGTSSRINAVVVPEFIVQGILSFLFLLTWQLIPFIIMAPITYYHVQMFWKQKHLTNVTEIFSHIEGQKKYRMVKLAFYISMFILVIYRLVVCAVTLPIDENDSPLVSGIY